MVHKIKMSFRFFVRVFVIYWLGGYGQCRIYVKCTTHFRPSPSRSTLCTPLWALEITHTYWLGKCLRLCARPR